MESDPWLVFTCNTEHIDILQLTTSHVHDPVPMDKLYQWQ